MKPIETKEVVSFVETNIGSFHQKRIASLESLKLSRVLKRKNPYLFKAKNILVAGELVRVLLDAHLSSQEETIFGEFLERLAIFVADKVFDGKKSSAEGIDLELQKSGVTYIVAIKSGPNWGNSSQIAKMKRDFERAQRILRTNNPGANIRAINGCCYGQISGDMGSYTKLCGQDFWYFLSDNDDLYVDIIEPLGHQAKEKNEAFQEEYAKLLTRFTAEFIGGYCSPDGAIDWARLIQFNSGRK